MDKSHPDRYYFPILASERRRLRIERLVDEAEGAVALYDWEAVREASQAVLAFDPDNSDALDLITGPQRALDSQAPQLTTQPTTTTPTA